MGGGAILFRFVDSELIGCPHDADDLTELESRSILTLAFSS